MDADIRPFLPFTDATPLLGFVPLDALHTARVAAGAVGLGPWALPRATRSPTGPGP